MHPAYSVILFTTASGAGYGLLIWLGLLTGSGSSPLGAIPALLTLGIALVLITAGLLSSTLHLGRPERAWRALSQWRSSWLSREGVAAVLTYLPALLLAGAWLWDDRLGWLLLPAAWLAVIMAVLTVWCTGMIYASLPTIAAWHQRVVTPLYLLLALATGGVLLNLLLLIHGHASAPVIIMTAALLAVAGLLKLGYWRTIDHQQQVTTAEATGLAAFGSVRSLDPPHSRPNFVMREMGYEVGRRHAGKLRQITFLLLFALPVLLLLAALASPAPASGIISGSAAVSAVIGVLIERWLFFAEARHISAAYYRNPGQPPPW